MRYRERNRVGYNPDIKQSGSNGLGERFSLWIGLRSAERDNRKAAGDESKYMTAMVKHKSRVFIERTTFMRLDNSADESNKR